MKFFAGIFFAAFSLSAQTNDLTATNATAAKVETNQPASRTQRAEQIRAECLQGRRIICGKILKVLPGGLVVDSGYTDLLRPALSTTWLVPGSVIARRPANVIESRQPESVAVGVVFLTDFPKSSGAAARPKPYDYVVLLGYPAGQTTYTSVGTVQKTVHRFSANILNAVKLNFETAEKSGDSSAAQVK
ncbi:MAG TPA: hypothetical protein VFC17_12560 [Candidatus Limnocylindrales bacterium]|nr:hypothetical protein [Candidatus Limnocylindrales bacterium]